jgi:hypothetical protein
MCNPAHLSRRGVSKVVCLVHTSERFRPTAPKLLANTRHQARGLYIGDLPSSVSGWQSVASA